MSAIHVILGILDELRDRIRGDAGPMAVLDALRPVLERYSGITSADFGTRRILQEQVHIALRNANLIPTEDL